ncbi:MAG: HD domain-containing protein [Gemmatimonadetes bacterium]|nr:HD domain-containing protein [Gemmatimonadota bacterium]
MSAPVAFLHTFVQSLSTLALYPPGHASRERSLEGLHLSLHDLLDSDPHPLFSFLGNEVVYGRRPLHELRDWEWGSRLSDVGIQRLEFDAKTAITTVELEAFLEEMLDRLNMRPADSSEARQTRETGIKYGAIGVGDETEEQAQVVTATIAFTLGEEAETIRWMHDELEGGQSLPLSEAEAVVRSLAMAMHGGSVTMVPLLRLREFDEYTTTHSLNVSVMTMALAEWVGLGAEDVRQFGMAGLMHDLGKVKIPKDLLNKPGRFDEAERKIMNSHPVEGARIILATEHHLDLAAVVAYEHHILINGGGYPTLKYPRDCHYASKLVHICDVYDALRTKRPYRDSWPAPKVLAYIEEKAGTEFDGKIAHEFTTMIRKWEPQIAVMNEDEELPAPVATPQSPAPVGPAPAQPESG